MARMESNTHIRNNEANLFTILTPTNTRNPIVISRIVPYARMLFSMTDDWAPPPATSPKRDMLGAMYV